MPDRRDDPTDHARTTLPRAGEAMKDSRGLPGYGLLGLAVLAIVVCLAAAAQSLTSWAIAAGVVAVLAVSVGSACVYAERRRVASVARQRSTDAEPPSVGRARRGT